MLFRNLLFSLLALWWTAPTRGFHPSPSSLRPFLSLPIVIPERLAAQTLGPSASSTTSQLFEQKGSVRFSGTDELTTTTNPLDSFLSLVASDIASIVLGLVGLLIVIIHRWLLLDDSAAVDAMALQTRTDLLAVFACGSVLLNGVTKLDVTSALSESVVLEGRKLGVAELKSDDTNSATTKWGLESLLEATPAETAILLERKGSATEGPWTITARAGIVPAVPIDIPETTPILTRVGSPNNSKETYLPTLQALPGKRELTYLPSNTQLALMIPIGLEGGKVLVLGGNTAKSFSPRDVAWCRIIAERIGNPQ